MSRDELESLRRSSSLPPAIGVEAGPGGLPVLRLHGTDGAQVDVAWHGGHVLDWRDPQGESLLFLSAHSRFAAGEPIRGGVPIVFPWFGAHPAHPEYPGHGFARRRRFRVSGGAQRGGTVVLLLDLIDDDSSRALWPHRFRLTLRVALGDQLEIGLTIANRGPEPLRCEAVLHTYFRVGDLRHTRIVGLAGRSYFDQLSGCEVVEERDALDFPGEVDRVFADAPGPVLIIDDAARRRIEVATVNAPSKVVWNPAADKAARLADLGDAEWQRFVCVETGHVGDCALTLAPGAETEAVTRLRVDSTADD